DYRSLYHNYECGVYLHNCACIADIEADFQRTLQVSVLAKENDINGGKTSAKIMGATLRLISPLL
ncbi:MAG: cardiolipin synthase, partial [Clostridia bacterium]|nr:cardiolipin synthase [Clostridia bacterium]